MPKLTSPILLIAIISLLMFGALISNRSTSAGQGKGGEVIAKPTPATKPATSRPAPRRNRSPESNSPAKFINQYKMEFVLIPPGKFMMGSVEGNEDSEKPVHGVTIGEPFYMARYEVTQWQWHAVMATTVDEQRRRVQQGSVDLPRRMSGQSESYPMYYVSWQEAHAFVQRLNALNDGYAYRLPSEAEWEYACRAGGSAERPTDLNSIAWYKTNSNDSVHDVGMKRPNTFGLYDMLGNVAEWCEDLSHDNYEGAPTDGSVWLGTPGFLGERVVRGPSFFSGNPAYLKCAARGGETENYRDFETGFRVLAVPRTR